MEIMGWSEASMAKRYMHVLNELVAAIADQVGDLVWSGPADAEADEQDGGGTELSDHQRETIRRLGSALPEPWRQRFADLLNDGDDGPTGVFVPA